jgi:hypothetical protein
MSEANVLEILTMNFRAGHANIYVSTYKVPCKHNDQRKHLHNAIDCKYVYDNAHIQIDK